MSERHCPSDSDSEPDVIFDPELPPPVDYSYILCGLDDPSAHPHWRRFEEYAAYVRSITGLFAFDGPRRLELWEDLGRCIAPAPLLPRLQAVSFRQDRTRRKFAAGTFYLLSDSVTSLEYGGREYHNPAIRSAILRAFCYAEEIQKIRIPMQPWEDMHTFGDHICHVEVIPEIESRALKYLAKIQHLRSLSLSLGAIDLADGMLTYPRLETLDLKGHWGDHTALLNITNAPNLHTLSLEVLQRGASAQMFAKYTSECLNAVSTRLPSLTSLAVRMNSSPPTPLVYSIGAFHRIVQSTFQTSLLDVVRPLLPLHALRAFTLILPNYIDMNCSSDDLLAVSEAWRDLEGLHIHLWDYFTLKGLINHPGAGERPRGWPFAAIAQLSALADAAPAPDGCDPSRGS
ncbi:hypothetical protein GSI_11521 [Ganoderma sinense ZZ0214-1]|uniref:F-box domain-containing protein n=1 Tax=Ganoderma sinense ZZ0214-1 TaxID=1077348 RepID=A0A2G8RW83_9APHY|nr:hypothetical protein GSI_11521 [Ganoderma sinense ZZ0214-1]